MIDDYIRSYGKRLFGLCLTLCGSVYDAEDLYQDTWIKVLDHFESYDTSREFEPWLTQICVNTYRNHLRRLARSPFLSFQTNEAKEAAFAAVAAPEKRDYMDIYHAIDRLPERLRVTVILYYFREMDIASTARVLKIPEGTVKSRLSKARKRLKEELSDASDLQF